MSRPDRSVSIYLASFAASHFDDAFYGREQERKFTLTSWSQYAISFEVQYSESTKLRDPPTCFILYVTVRLTVGSHCKVVQNDSLTQHTLNMPSHTLDIYVQEITPIPIGRL